MTARPEVLASGEVSDCLRNNVARPCTCGKLGQDYPIWRPFCPTAAPLRAWMHVELTLALLENAMDHYAFTVDSSETAWGALKL